MKLPQFTVGDLLLAIALVSIGLVCLSAAWPVSIFHPMWMETLIGFAGAVFMGAGIFTLLHRRLRGAVIFGVMFWPIWGIIYFISALVDIWRNWD